MQIVIEIDEERYNDVKNQVKNGIDNPLKVIIANGTPLPKGHGRLIDADLLDMKRIDYILDGYANDADDCAEFGMMIISAPTIIEADGGDAE